MSTQPSSQITLVRGLGLIAALSIVIGNVIGTGVFLKARVMTCNVGEPSTVILVWIAAGLLSLAGALTYAELAAMFPQAGGEYVFLRKAYGAPAGFLYGWMQFIIAKTGSQAALGVSFAIFLNELTKGALNAKYFTLALFGRDFDFGLLQVVALLAIIIVTLINCAAVSFSGSVATVLTVIKIALVLVVGAGAFLFASGDWAHFAQSGAGGLCEDVNAATRIGVAGFSAGFAAAMLGALWAYDGWNNLTLIAGEVKNPQRNIPIALIGGMALIAALYIFISVAYYYVLAPQEVASVAKSSSVAAETARRFMGAGAVSLIAMALLASTFGTLHTSILTGARVPYAMARDGLFFKSFGRISPKSRVPVSALLVQGAWACVLALSGSFDQLTNYVIFASWIFYGLVTASVFIFRKRMPDAERPYRAWGYPVVPALFLLVTAWLLLTTLWSSTFDSLVGLGLIAIGIPVYFYFARLRGGGVQAEDMDIDPKE